MVGMRGEDQTEERLLAGVGRAEVSAFEDLYDRYSRSVYSLAMTMLRDAEAAREVTQEVFLDLWRTARAFEPTRGSARSWILSLAHHKSVDAVRRRRLRAVEPLSEALPSGQDVAAEAAAALARGRVREALSTLTLDQRNAIALAYYGGYTQREIAERLGIPLGTIKTRMRDGMIRLRGLLGADVTVAEP
jgi:RNA polymerase sigma-70 factor (ECF subfamily)